MKYIKDRLNKIAKKISVIKQVLLETDFPVLSRIEFERLLSQINNIWGLRSIKRSEIKEFLIKENLLIQEHIKSDEAHSSEIYYLPERTPDIFDIAAVRSRSSYFSFYSALYIHNLTLQIPKQIYLTLERPSLEKYNNSISQDNVDRVFSKPPRITGNKRSYKTFAINFINAQHQNNVGVITFRDHYKMSDLERTLIDICVRPFYSGGVTQVLEAFSNARNLLDPDKLYEYYSKMNFIYPYHQAIGFYLQKAGYGEEVYKKFLELQRSNLRFYLTYTMLHQEYSEKWNLYFPKGL
ncbi:hypothetical protein [Chryseobacterium sp.]|uniref:hypothetical protein n=1 Tax=Chryseobacterium sp. TaxID=1871047 RepID=UPI0012A89AD9|nr:hypothetical protein [Chryseobacterium sp.]QFG54497.1 hypothetical protein F7R58_12845 [Chryseobacterium sp.]